MNEVIQNRVQKLRGVMQQKNIDYYMISTADFHGSEYVNDYFKVREFLCGFTGSNGTLLVWQEGAALWTDGRYFIQAAAELDGTGVTLMQLTGEESTAAGIFFVTISPDTVWGAISARNAQAASSVYSVYSPNQRSKVVSVTMSITVSRTQNARSASWEMASMSTSRERVIRASNVA